eukprot:5939345-Pleurochrysis_carterae.AAC.1
MPQHPARRQLDWKLFTVGVCRGAKTDAQAHDQYIGSWTLSQRLAALVADAAAICMQAARLAIVNS